MSLQSPLGRFLGLGSAKDGTHHWWSQRLTSVALVPLTLWFVTALVGMSSFAHPSIVVWLAQPLNSILLILLLLVMLHHSQLGLQVVVEDYVHAGGLKVLILMLSRFAHLAAGVAAIYSIIILSVGTAN